MFNWLLSYLGRGQLEYWRGERKVKEPISFKVESFDQKNKMYVLYFGKITTRIVDSANICSIYFRGQWRKPWKVLSKYGNDGSLVKLVMWVPED